MTFTGRAVDAGGVELATLDYGGDGLPLVLMHGAGMEQGSLVALAEQLRSSFRVVTFDFRGHGGSGTAPWTFESAVDDLEAVADAYGLAVPAVGGHSVGGMVAAAYGARHATCPGVINIDGHGRGRADQYPGYDEPEVHEWWEHVERRLDRLTRGAGAVALRALMLAQRKKPTTTAETLRQLLREVNALDVFSSYRQLVCPLLVFNATAPDDRRAMRVWAGKGTAMVAAYRNGLHRDLTALAAERKTVDVVTVDATHLLIRTHPALVAHHVTAFLQPVRRVGV